VIAKVESRTIADIEIISVVLTTDVGEYDHAPVASAVFGLPECKHLMAALLTEACRGVSADRLSYVLRHGIDVDPTDAPIWVSSIDKAMEYGGWPKLILVLDVTRLDRTFREPVDAVDRASLRRMFPTEVASEDGSQFWLSRLAATDRRLASEYEVAYGRWIPGNARDALVAILAIQHPAYGQLLNLNDFAEIKDDGSRPGLPNEAL